MRGFAARSLVRHGPLLLLVSVALVSRIALMSVSLDEVDSANFHNAVAYGYNISAMRPHPPGYPVYMFASFLIDSLLDDPLRSLTLRSAVLGSLAAVPFYLLLREFLGSRTAFVGTILFLASPLVWSVSEAALSDAPSMFFSVLLALLCYRARRSNLAFVAACVVGSVAVGIRPPNLALLPLLAFPLAYRAIVTRSFQWGVVFLGGGLFAITTLTWFGLMLELGSSGIQDYSAALSRQWSGAVAPYDVTQVASPKLLNSAYRVERFAVGYLLTYAWIGSDVKRAETLLLVAPWLFGLALFVANFRWGDPRHVFVGMWMLSLLYPILAIHFLPRYGLSQLPAFILACALGYQFVTQRFPIHRRTVETLAVLGIGTVLILYGIKYQSPISTFEGSPPDGVYPAGVFVTLGVACFLLGRWLSHGIPLAVRASNPVPRALGRIRGGYGMAVFLLLIAATTPYVMKGYSVASIAHVSPSPVHRLVEFVDMNFDSRQVSACWDNQTHSFYDAMVPGVYPLVHRSAAKLVRAHRSGRMVIVSDRFPWYNELRDSLGLS